MQGFREDLIHRTELLKFKETLLKDQLNTFRLLDSSVADLTEKYRVICSETVEPSTALQVDELRKQIADLDVEKCHLNDLIQQSESGLNEKKQVALVLDQQNTALQDRISQLVQTNEAKRTLLATARNDLAKKQKELAETKEKLAEHELLVQSLAQERERTEQAYIDQIETKTKELSEFYEQLCRDGQRLDQALATFKNN